MDIWSSVVTSGTQVDIRGPCPNVYNYFHVDSPRRQSNEWSIALGETRKGVVASPLQQSLGVHIFAFQILL